MENFSQWADTLAAFLEVIFELISSATIVLGLILSLRVWRSGVRAVQLAFAGYLLLALEFLLAADVLATLRAPTWQDIARLGAVALIRTGLDFYLSRELREERFREPRTTNSG
ncbi:putative membrane protein [Deinobacterium chartae]|uniref:Putative membrane protein n=1 Tax=Deinobacterium chartae TaxID=521158 RepID=A0A841HXI2_9DEIO|nr:DUF1622 domain-containing protein [Deinobacterium chartae]MBB6097563.1 putative membrane protein [Deinobacterium chartae]